MTPHFDPETGRAQTESSRGTDRIERAERIEGWKAVAAILGQSVRTVQRWHVRGLPVYRKSEYWVRVGLRNGTPKLA